MKECKIFSVVRERKGKGRDKPGDLFYVRAEGNPSLVEKMDSPAFAYITGFVGTSGTREIAQQLANLLNSAVDEFHKG